MPYRSSMRGLAGLLIGGLALQGCGAAPGSPELPQGEAGRKAHPPLTRLTPPGASVRLERDVAPRDRYGRELAHVWTGRRLVNEALVLEGWAVLYTVPPNVKYAERLERAQKKARAAR